MSRGDEDSVKIVSSRRALRAHPENFLGMLHLACCLRPRLRNGSSELRKVRRSRSRRNGKKPDGESQTTRLMIGKRLAHYEISAQPGVGGMGVVYRATDTRLERSVAIKFASC